VHSKKLLEFQEGRFGFRSKDKIHITFLSYFESIMNTKKNDSSNSSYSNWRSSLNHIRKFTRNDLKLSEVNHKYLNDLKKYFQNGDIGKGGRKLTPNTALSYFKNVKYTLREAYNEGLILDNPGNKIKNIKSVETHREFLTEEEIQKLFQTECQLPIIKRSFLFGCLTGLRFSDILKLEWKNVQQTKENGWFIRFQQQKTKGSETFHITNQARKLLSEMTEPKERVFKELKYSAHNNQILRKWIEDAGITKHITFHS